VFIHKSREFPLNTEEIIYEIVILEMIKILKNVLKHSFMTEIFRIDQFSKVQWNKR
jgi:hypothetical protein